MEPKVNKIGIDSEPIVNESENALFPREYILSLATFIKECNTPMTISLQGEWGIGKTSFFNLVKNEVKENVCCIDTINAWTFSQFDADGNLSIIIMKALIDSINPNETTAFDVAYNVGSGILRGIIKKHADIDIRFSDIYSKDFFQEVKSLKDRFQKIINEKIEKENTEYGKQVNRALIFIDDLDRISPEKAVEILECFKNFLDVENCVFVFAIDYDVIVKGACKKFGEEKGQAFFDKIIKLPFVLPVEHYSIEKFVMKIANSLFAEDEHFSKKDTLNLYLRIIGKSIGNNPRTIGRIFNSFYIMYKMDKISYEDKKLKPKQGNVDPYEIRINDLYFFFCCIRFSLSNLYNYLINDIEKINGKDKAEVNKYIDDLRNEFEVYTSEKVSGNTKDKYNENSKNNQKDLIELYCEILKKINNIDSLSEGTLYAIISRERATGGHINKL